MAREDIGARIARRRRALGLTQRELADMLHVTDRAVSRWERGAGAPDVSLLVPLSRALDMSTDELLTGTPARREYAPPPPVGIPYFCFRLYRIVGWTGAGIMLLPYVLLSFGLHLGGAAYISVYVLGTLIFLSSMFVVFPLFYRCPGCGRLLFGFRAGRKHGGQTQHCTACGTAVFSDLRVGTLKEYRAHVRRAKERGRASAPD